MASSTSPKKDENIIWQALYDYYYDADKARQKRMLQNQENFQCFNMEQDWSHKTKGQSKEFLPKQAQAVEETTSFLQQGLMDVGDWFRIKREPGVTDEDVIFQDHEIQKLLNRQLKKNDFVDHMGDSLKLGQLQSLMITKVGGTMVDMVSFEAEQRQGFLGNFFRGSKNSLKKNKKKAWQLKLYLVRAENWYPDPTGNNLYNQEAIEIDYHELLQLAKDNPDDFDMDVVRNINENPDYEQERKKARETNQDEVYGSSRKRIRLIEHWGAICHPQTGELLHENVVARFTLDGKLVSPPKKNPLWHGENPYVTSPILRVPLSVWHKALTDGPTYLNKALNELFNLQFDSGMMSVFGIRQIREDWLDNPEEVSDGIAPGQTLKASSQCPPGGKVLETVATGALTEESLTMFNMADREFQSASFSSDIRMGQLPQRAVKATEIVASNQSIQGIFNGIVKRLEEVYVAKILYKSWVTCAQHMDDLDSTEVKALLGEERANLLSNISKEERFAKTARGHKYEVYGMSQTLNKIQDFKKITTLLQTIGTSNVLMQEFMKKYSVTKLLGEIVKSLDISEEKILADPQELAQREQERQQQMAILMAQAQAKAGGKRSLEQGANVQSQIPQASAMPDQEPQANPANDASLTSPE